MHKSIIVFEAEGDSDKYFDRHRKDTISIIDAIREAGWSAEVVYYRPEWKNDLYDYVSQNFDGYVSRVDPGDIPGDERGYFELLTSPSVAGLVGMFTPGEMMAYGTKDALVKLKNTDPVPSDTTTYYDVEALHSTLPASLSYDERILKQNRGFIESGIWRVRIADEEAAKNIEPSTLLPLDIKLKCTKAVDNHTEIRELGEFMDFYDQYIIGDNGMFVDMRLMPHITEGEIRILLAGPHPAFVIHKKSAEDGDVFSATLLSGAKYTYSKSGEWQNPIDMFAEARPVIVENLDGDNIPLTWTTDFMPADSEDSEDTYIFGEISCSCVGFTSKLDMGIQGLVAQEAIKHVEATNK